MAQTIFPYNADLKKTTLESINEAKPELLPIDKFKWRIRFQFSNILLRNS